MSDAPYTADGGRGPSPRPPDLAKFEQTELGNGLSVFVAQDPTATMAAVHLNIRAGAGRDANYRAGTAHFAEHIYFEGTPQNPGHFNSYVEAWGGRANGATGRDRTTYWSQVPETYLEQTLALEADRFFYAGQQVDPHTVEVQRRVILQERAEQKQRDPFTGLREAVHAQALGAQHHYAQPILGHDDDINAIKAEDVSHFLKTYYRPEHASLIVISRLASEEVLEQISKLFDRNPAAKPAAHPSSSALQDYPSDLGQLGPQSRLHFCWQGAPFLAKHDAALDLLADILGERPNGLLVEALQQQAPMVHGIAVQHQSRKDDGLFEIKLTWPTGSCSAPFLQELLSKVMQNLAKAGVSALDLEQAQRRHQLTTLGSIDRPGGFGGIADVAGLYEALVGDPDMFAADQNRYAALSPTDLEAALRYLLEQSPTVLSAAPTPSGTRPRASFDHRRPAAGPAKIPDLPQPPAWPRPSMDQGKVAAYQFPTALTPGLHWWSPRGSDHEPSEIAGVSRLLEAIFDERLFGMAQPALTQELQRRGVRMGLRIAGRHSLLSLMGMPGQEDELVPVLEEVLHHPQWQALDLDRWRDRLAQRRDSLQRNPDFLLDFGRKLLEADIDQPILRFPTATTSARFSLENTIAAYGTLLPAGDGRMFITHQHQAGLATLQTACEAFLAGAKRQHSNAAPAAAPDLDNASTDQRLLMPLADAGDQAHLRIVQRLPAWHHHDYAAAELWQIICGGSFQSRLHSSLRHEHGLVYDLQCHLESGAQRSYMTIDLQCHHSQVQQVLSLVEQILRSPQPLIDRDLRMAKAHLWSQAERVTTAGGLVRWLKGATGRGETAADVDQRRAQQWQLTTAELNNLVHKFAATGMQTILVAPQTAFDSWQTGSLPKLD